MTTPEIEELKNMVEDKYGKQLSATNDFEHFSLKFYETTRKNISTSTLKRIWGYVDYDHKPRTSILDMLSTYIGFKSFKDFNIWLKTSPKFNSSFFNASQLISSEIVTGSEVEIGWSPNRLVRMIYRGDSMFEVAESYNSKLQPGDRFITGCLIKEQPLYLPFIERNGERTPAFVAGRNGGLTVINYREKKHQE